MVADRIEVTSRRAGSPEAWVWTSDRRRRLRDRAGERGSRPQRVTRGTEIVLHLKDDAKKYLEGHEIRRVVSTYSDHILFPIELVTTGERHERAEIRQDQFGERAVAALEVGVDARRLQAGLPAPLRTPSTSPR